MLLPETKVRRGSMIWPILTLIFFVIAAVMTSLFVWVVLKPENQEKVRDAPTTLPNIDVPCPRHPPLFRLPTPFPTRIKKALNSINTHLVDLVESPEVTGNLSAMSIKIVYLNTSIFTGNYGSKVFKGSLPPDDNTRYRIGSVTKIFPVLLLYKLYEDGIIKSLDDPLEKYAPTFSIKNPFGDKTNDNITLRQIASQMSGLPREAPCGYRCKNTTTREQLALLQSQYLVVKPYTIPSYSNLGYALLGRLLTQNLLNTTFEAWVKENILVPLGMKNTGIEITKAVKKDMALPYFPNGTVMPFMDLGWAGPAGDMYSTTTDLMKLAKIFLYPEEQSIFKPETLREMLLPDFITNDGFWLWGSPFEMRFTNHFLARQKGGNVETYNAVFSVIPELKLALSVLVNNSPVLKNKGYTCFKVADFVHATLIPPLNETLYEMKRGASFPVPAKPFLGRFQVSQTSMLTGKTGVINATIVEDQNVLKLVPEIPILRELGFLLIYFGNPLVFQGFSNQAAHGTPCVTSHFGMYGTIEFEPPGRDGLSWRFSSKSVKVKGVRLSEKESISTKVDKPENLDEMFYNILS